MKSAVDFIVIGLAVGGDVIALAGAVAKLMGWLPN